MAGSGERDLWVAVLQTAIGDARSGDSVSQRWLTLVSLDLRLVCDLAGIEAEHLVAKCRREFDRCQAGDPAPPTVLLARLAAIRARAMETMTCMKTAIT